MDRREDYAWAAGIVDGEGSTYLAHSTSRSHGKYYEYDRMRLSVPQYSNDGTPQMLQRLLDLFGGNLNGPYGPYSCRPNAKPQYQWAATGFENVQNVLACIWPWLGDVKRVQATKAMKKYIASEIKGA